MMVHDINQFEFVAIGVVYSTKMMFELVFVSKMVVVKDELIVVVVVCQVIVVFGSAVFVAVVCSDDVVFDTAIELVVVVDGKGFVVIAFVTGADNVAVAHDAAVDVVDWRIWAD